MVRRIVTHTNEAGKSFIAQDASARNTEVPLPQINQDLKLYNLWTTDEMPVDYTKQSDPIDGVYVSTTPPQNGSLFRFVNYPPEQELLKKFAHMPAAELEALSQKIGVELDLNARHPLMHKTQSIDFAIVISGEIYLILDEEETLLKPGDTVIQRGTNHAWSNRSDTDCLMAYVLLDAKRHI